MAERERQTGCVHIYCGDGKGKTTCGMGLCLRAAGAGLSVMICQFMKDNRSSERRALAHVEGIRLLPGPEREKFSFRMTAEEKKEKKRENGERFREAVGRAEKEGCQVLFLDELIYAIRAGLFEEEQLLRFLDEKPEDLEVILTGQGPSEELLARADYVTEMKKIKHPFDRALAARDGIER